MQSKVCFGSDVEEGDSQLLVVLRKLHMQLCHSTSLLLEILPMFLWHFPRTVFGTEIIQGVIDFKQKFQKRLPLACAACSQGS